MSEDSRIGFIGLGAMGKPMASNLLDAGFDLVVHNRSAPSVEELVAKGAKVAGSPAEVAGEAATIITMLPDTGDVADVLRGDDGVIRRSARGTLIIDMSTISPTATIELAETAHDHGCAMLDAPVSGGDVGAAAGTLSIMVGGDSNQLERARPLLEAMGQTIVHVGPNGAGQLAKACNQIVVAGTIAAISEALTLATRAGIDLPAVIEVLQGGLAANKILEVRGQNFIDQDFEPGFRAALHLKDLGIALRAGQSYSVPLPSTAVVTQLFSALVARGGGDLDHTGLMLLVREFSNGPSQGFA